MPACACISVHLLSSSHIVEVVLSLHTLPALGNDTLPSALVTIALLGSITRYWSDIHTELLQVVTLLCVPVCM